MGSNRPAQIDLKRFRRCYLCLIVADDAKLELLKLEYEKAADRYQEIYRSIWTIFSYLSAITAGVLAYGFDKFDTSALIAVAPIPLLFWFTTTYLPLDRYGNKVLDRLTTMETLAETLFQFPMCHFKDVSDSKTTQTIYRALKAGREKKEPIKSNWGRQYHRARFRIWIWFWIGLVFWSYHTISFMSSGRPFLLPKERSERPMNIELIQSAPLIESNR